MKIWLDDIRPAPKDYILVKSVREAIQIIQFQEDYNCLALSYYDCAYDPIEVIDCDHDLGDYAKDGGDGIKLLDWLVENKKFYPIKLHTMNPVGRENMERMIRRYWPNV